MKIDKNRNDQIIKALEAKGASNSCSRCGESRFEIVGESFIPIQDNPNVLSIGGPSVPTVIVACSSCGHVWHHALGVLGLLRG
jgi:uncharacterized Zn finger protein